MTTRTDRILDGLFTWVGRLIVGIGALFMAVPALFIAMLSFSNDQHIAFPPKTWGVNRYVDLFTSDTWAAPIGLSLRLAAVTAVVALLLVLPAIIGLKRSNLRGGGFIEGASVAPMLFPVAAYAVGLYAVFAEVGLLASFQGIVISHVIHAVPMVVIILSTAMDQIRPELELAAMTMGASRGRAWLGVTLRLLTPAVAGAAIFAFVSSFDEAVFITFLGGPGLVTLPKLIFDSVQFGVDPAITAVATVLMIVTSALLFFATRLRKDVR
ncbi:ABC transporter permease [Planosporangium flavigriseum]|uniref:Polyamine ABC transporter permease n=1 Tax=Planosporangium flavigriseum TaxID=373681 RepID=A0A8J3LKY5_9ACTN|nr:ABC transporter permease [Planosporangium flavigriseum]NJC66065.1 ABC transporter permease [Planosporangium flavigriseum]GIG75098.1 polyamine ABC transporter permease [Planosporangium flavigriseum]